MSISPPFAQAAWLHSPEQATLACGIPVPPRGVYPSFLHLSGGGFEVSAPVLRFFNLHVLTAAFSYTTSGISPN